MQKIVAVMRQLAYGTANDAQTEYSGVKRVCARKALYSYCKFIIHYPRGWVRVLGIVGGGGTEDGNGGECKEGVPRYDG